MNRILGVVSLLVLMYGLLFAVNFEFAAQWSNLKDVLGQQAFFAILTLGVGTLIITGGIDLSIGSVVGLSAVLFGSLMEEGILPIVAMLIVLGLGIVIGIINAALVNGLKLQPFLVTLCGLFFYRGLARMLHPGKPVGLQSILKQVEDAPTTTEPKMQTFTDQLEFLRLSLVGKDLDSNYGWPMQAFVLIAIAIVLGVLVHFSVCGRHWYAIGHSEQAARYAGVRVARQKYFAYIISSFCASLGGVLVLLDYSSANPAGVGETWELYAITGAVLGGCSLRGGEGTVPGMVLGAAVLPLLKNLISFVANLPWMLRQGIQIDPIVPSVIGLTLLLGTLADEYFRRQSTRRA